jgi:hypothetical protein
MKLSSLNVDDDVRLLTSGTRYFTLCGWLFGDFSAIKRTYQVPLEPLHNWEALYAPHVEDYFDTYDASLKL